MNVPLIAVFAIAMAFAIKHKGMDAPQMFIGLAMGRLAGGTIVATVLDPLIDAVKSLSDSLINALFHHSDSVAPAAAVVIHGASLIGLR